MRCVMGGMPRVEKAYFVENGVTSEEGWDFGCGMRGEKDFVSWGSGRRSFGEGD